MAVHRLALISRPIVRVLPDPAQLAWEAAGVFVRASTDAITATGRFAVAFSGGSTPKAMLELLASAPFVGQVDWNRTHILFADERCVPPDHPHSNFGMVDRLLIDKVDIPLTNVHRMAGELDPVQAAARYDAMLQQDFPLGLDLILLGLGEDGHTASLFPGTGALNATTEYCLANHVPQLDSWRLTLTAAYINKAFDIAFLVSGASKAPMVARILESPVVVAEVLPAQLITPATHQPLWLLDASAAGMDLPEDE